ncbi:hypothetical protein [Streptomyces sp. NBC_01431]|uniref:hypothetical protein n=1 Tax=Streptomyces sp. NBC_01431 TaxID=2903863 RepID=UPI002E311F31|nr:hypothetical protein [Streptomyces sp. NBC_01431]
MIRPVKHSIGTHPHGEITVSARCLDSACLWTLAATSDLKAADLAMMTHTGLSGHPTFARTFEDVALVRRLELDEGKQEIPPPSPQEPQHERAAP